MAVGNLSFNAQGATPFQPQPYSINIPNTNPVSRALLKYGGNSGLQTTTPQYASFSNDNGTGIGSAPAPATYGPSVPQGTSSGLIPPSNQAVKSHSVTNADGSTVTQTYHPPTDVAPVTPEPQNTALNKATSGLLNIGNTSNAQNASQAENGLLNAGSANTDLSRKAQDIANAAGQEISDIGRKGAMGQAGYLSTGTSPVGEGNAAILNQSTAAQQQAVAQGAEAQLTGTQQGLTAQGQTQSALNQAGGLALTGQGNKITALQNAGNLSQPVSQFGVLGTPQSVGAFGSNNGSAAFQGGFIGGQQAAGQAAAQMNTANTAAKGIEGTIQQYLAANPQLNSSASTLANAASQWVQGKQLGDPTYQTLFNYLNEYISTLAPILGVGGDTTNLKTEIAQSFVNAKASGQSISQVLNSIGKLADDKYANFVSAGQGGGQVAGGVPSGATPTSFGTEW